MGLGEFEGKEVSVVGDLGERVSVQAGSPGDEVLQVDLPSGGFLRASGGYAYLVYVGEDHLLDVIRDYGPRPSLPQLLHLSVEGKFRVPRDLDKFILLSRDGELEIASHTRGSGFLTMWVLTWLHDKRQPECTWRNYGIRSEFPEVVDDSIRVCGAGRDYYEFRRGGEFHSHMAEIVVKPRRVKPGSYEASVEVPIGVNMWRLVGINKPLWYGLAHETMLRPDVPVLVESGCVLHKLEMLSNPHRLYDEDSDDDAFHSDEGRLCALGDAATGRTDDPRSGPARRFVETGEATQIVWVPGGPGLYPYDEGTRFSKPYGVKLMGPCVGGEVDFGLCYLLAVKPQFREQAVQLLGVWPRVDLFISLPLEWYVDVSEMKQIAIIPGNSGIHLARVGRERDNFYDVWRAFRYGDSSHCAYHYPPDLFVGNSNVLAGWLHQVLPHVLFEPGELALVSKSAALLSEDLRRKLRVYEAIGDAAMTLTFAVRTLPDGSVESYQRARGTKTDNLTLGTVFAEKLPAGAVDFVAGVSPSSGKAGAKALEAILGLVYTSADLFGVERVMAEVGLVDQVRLQQGPQVARASSVEPNGGRELDVWLKGLLPGLSPSAGQVGLVSRSAALLPEDDKRVLRVYEAVGDAAMTLAFAVRTLPGGSVEAYQLVRGTKTDNATLGKAFVNHVPAGAVKFAAGVNPASGKVGAKALEAILGLVYVCAGLDQTMKVMVAVNLIA